MGNIDGGAPGTPVARSRSMAAGMDEASYQRMARGGVRKRFTALKARGVTSLAGSSFRGEGWGARRGEAVSKTYAIVPFVG